ncbi:LEA type 2 family protein [Breznakiella homolactica]|uniref:LEA type 2 family protein n=1 Tax=Breznakiella homolactica TaxID=2798577 RepID=A0A7T8BBX6_9SPIR|nr:LEA type 2 family protein [Breznakiella homolactica]QQO11027.1 LEA type 2 family protein [Breznakiella homolactica]
MKKYGVLFIAAACVVLCTCQSLEGVFKEPKISFNSANITAIDFNGIELLCRVNVENPNSYTIPFPEIDWDFAVNGNDFIRGTLENNGNIQARKTTVVDIPIAVTYEGLFNTFASLMGADEVGYGVALGLRFPLPILESRTFSLDFSGTIPLLKIPAIKVKALEIAKINFEGIDMRCSVAVENPNVFSIPVPDLAWEYEVQGYPLLKSTIAGGGALEAKAAGTIDFGLHVSFAELFAVAASLVQAREADFAMALAADFPVPLFSDSDFSLEQLGKIPILRMPKVSFGGLEVKNTSLQRIEAGLSWEIRNENDYSFTLDRFAYDFSVNSASWASGSVPENLVIPPRGSASVPVTISLQSGQIIQELLGLISGNRDFAYSSGGSLELSSSLPGFEGTELPFAVSGVTKIRK